MSPPPFVSKAERKKSDWRRRNEYQSCSGGEREWRLVGLYLWLHTLEERPAVCFCFNICETKSEGENCKETNWDLENLEDGKQSLNLLFILNVQSDKCESTNYCIFQRKNKVHLVICHSCTVAQLQIQSHESFVLKF